MNGSPCSRPRINPKRSTPSPCQSSLPRNRKKRSSRRPIPQRPLLRLRTSVEASSAAAGPAESGLRPAGKADGLVDTDTAMEEPTVAAAAVRWEEAGSWARLSGWVGVELTEFILSSLSFFFGGRSRFSITSIRAQIFHHRSARPTVSF
jgi:hypothetical protein